MTHSTTNTERENQGSVDAAFHTIDITALDAAGSESYDPSAELGLEGATRYGVTVRGLADDSYRAVYNHTTGELAVTNAADGTDVASGTAVGEVVLHVVGA